MDEFMKLLNAYTEALEKANEWPGVRKYGLARYEAKQALLAWAKEADQAIIELAEMNGCAE